MFEFENGKTVKYDLSSGETIGKLGKPVKSLNSQLRGYNVYDVIESFENEEYKKFLRFVLKNFVNNCRDRKRNSYVIEVDRVKNIGTFLSRLCFYDYFEQFFAAGIFDVDKDLKHKLNEIPKQLVKLSKTYKLKLSEQLIKDYNRNPDLFNNMMLVELDSVSPHEIYHNILKISEYRYRTNKSNFYILMENYNYSAIPLIKYIDNLITYEALNLIDTTNELLDYCNMMSVISPKYDKYPKNFLTTHKIATRNYERLKTDFNEELYRARVDKYLEWSINDYMVIYPECTQDIKDEAVQQNHCVSSYIDRVIDGKCHIVFLRSSKEPEKSLVTMEIECNMVVQSKGKFNRDLTNEESEIVKKYNKYLSKRNMINLNYETEELQVC